MQFNVLGTFFLVFFLFSADLSWAEGKVLEKGARSPLNYPVSLHSMLMSKNTNVVQNQVSDECIQAVQKTVKAGKNFASKIMLKESLSLIEFPREDVQAGVFYHWTRAEEMEPIAKAKKFSSIYGFLRSRCDSSYVSCLGSWYFYVAADDSSSSEFGPYLYEVRLKKNARIFIHRGDFHPQSFGTNELKDLVEEELIEKEDDLNACRDQLYYREYGVPSILQALALEATGISAVSYYGVDNRYAEKRGGHQWLQVVGPWVIQSMQRVR